MVNNESDHRDAVFVIVDAVLIVRVCERMSTGARLTLRASRMIRSHRRGMDDVRRYGDRGVRCAISRPTMCSITGPGPYRPHRQKH
jgi:hypothetical protein